MCRLSGDPVQGNALHTLTGMLRIIEGRLSSRTSGTAQGKNQTPYRLYIVKGKSDERMPSHRAETNEE